MQGFSHKRLPVEITEKNTLILLEDICYTDKKGNIHQAKKGFEFDGASIHRFFWRIITHPFSAKIVLPALFHDNDYKNGVRSKETSDNMFKESMEVDDKLPKWKQAVVYLAVDCCGDKAWKNHRKNDIINQTKKEEL